jgi:hypothetical protein
VSLLVYFLLYEVDAEVSVRRAESVASWPKSGLPGPSSPCGDTRSKASVPLFKEASIPIWGCPGVCIRDGYVWRSQTDSIAS